MGIAGIDDVVPGVDKRPEAAPEFETVPRCDKMMLRVGITTADFVGISRNTGFLGKRRAVAVEEPAVLVAGLQESVGRDLALPADPGVVCRVVDVIIRAIRSDDVTVIPGNRGPGAGQETVLRPEATGDLIGLV